MTDRFWIAGLYVLGALAFPHSGHAADPSPYASESACLRAETPAICAKWFKPPPERKQPARSLDACTGMMYESARYFEHAVIALRYDQRDEYMDALHNASSLAQQAESCAKWAKPSTAQQQKAWQNQREDALSQAAVLEAAMNAKQGVAR